jgi:urease accessory protein
MTDSCFTNLPTASAIARAPGVARADDRVVLTYDQRFLRRKRLETAGGLSFLVDLPETVSLQAGDAFLLSDGRAVAIEAAEEPVLRITGDLPRLAWHIGNRHTPCQFLGDALVIRADHVLLAMLRQLGAEVTETVLPFAPEGGAYGHGRTLGHDHGGHDHGHDHGHGHDHDHGETFGFARRASPIQWLMRNPQASEGVVHDLPAHGPFDDDPA